MTAPTHLTARSITVIRVQPGLYRAYWQGPSAVREQLYNFKAKTLSKAYAIVTVALACHDDNAYVAGLVHAGHMQPSDIHGPMFRGCLETAAR